LCEQVEAEWFETDQKELLQRLHAEHANLREALDYCATHPGEAGSGLEMASALRFFWRSTGLLNEGHRWLECLLTAETEGTPQRLKALYIDAYLAILLDDTSIVPDRLRQAEQLAQRLGDNSAAAYVAQMSALATMFAGDPARASEPLEKAIALHRANQNEGAVAYDLVVLALACALFGDHQRAAELFQECSALRQGHAEDWLSSFTLWARGVAALLAGDVGKATDLEREGLLVWPSFNDRFQTTLCIEVLAWAAAESGDAERAATLFGAADAIIQESGGHLTTFRHLRPQHDKSAATARGMLGDTTFRSFFDAGAKMSVEEAVEHARGGRTPAITKSKRSAKSAITRREREVASLVAKGMTNRTIADTLVVSKRTVDAHIEHILSKLSFTSRAQITAWVAEHQW
jgi:non-specific serine/threonine protein kinase